MGQEVAPRVFSREDRQRYREKVRACLDVFARMLSASRFESDRRSFGLEIELNLTDDGGDPALANASVLEAIADPDFQTELAQFNVEINIPPRAVHGREQPPATTARRRGVLRPGDRGARQPQPRRGARALGARAHDAH